MGLQVYINDRQIELLNEKTIGQTFQVGSILFPNSRRGNLTNKFKAPKSKLNNEILGNLSNINSETNIPYQLNSGKTIQNGIELISNGFAMVDGTSDNYEIVIYSGNTSFFDLIEGVNVNELDWSTSNHAHDRTSITASWNRDRDYIYPIVDWGTGLSNYTTLDFRGLLPCTFIKSVFDKTMALTGHTLVGAFTGTSEYKRLLLTPTDWGISERETFSLNGLAFHRDFSNELSQDADPFVGFETVPNGVGYKEVVMPTTFDERDFPFYNFQFSELGYSPHEDTTGNITCDYRFTPNINAAQDIIGIYAELKVLEDGAVIFTSTNNTPFTVLASTSLNFVNAESSFSTDDIFFKKGSFYTLAISIFMPRTAVTYHPHFTNTSFKLNIIIFGNIPFNGGSAYSFKTIYDYSLKKVWKDVINIYGLIVSTNDLTKEVSLNRLDDLEKNIHLSRKWSNIIDLSKSISIKYRLDSFAQINNFNYAESEDVKNKHGNGTINVNDVNLQKDTDVIQLNASSAESHTFDKIGYSSVPLIPIRKTKTSIIEEKNIRFLMLDETINPVTIQDSSQSGSDIINVPNMPFCYFSKEGKKDSLDFDSLISENYSVLSSMLNQTKFLTASFRLSEIDVLNFDFSIPVYLDFSNDEYSINGYFYVNVISNFKSGDSTKCELIRI